MEAPSHAIEVWHLSSGSWVGTCACGWIAAVSASRGDVLSAATYHAPDAPISDANPIDAPPLADGSDRATPAAAGRRHIRLRATMLHAPDGATKFRARCSCGWTSGPVDIGRVVVIWERHYDDAAPGSVTGSC